MSSAASVAPQPDLREMRRRQMLRELGRTALELDAAGVDHDSIEWVAAMDEILRRYGR